MWITEKKTGKYYEERVTDPVTGWTRIISAKIRKDTTQGRKQAREKLLEKIIEQKPVQRRKLSDLYEGYLAEQKITVRPQTYKRNEYVSHTMIATLGDAYLDKLSAGYIRRKLIETGKSPDTLNEALRRLKAALRWGYHNNYFENRELIDGLVLFNNATPNRIKIENKYLEKEDLQTLLAAMNYTLWRYCCEFMALSGLRPGEALALDWDDIGESISVHKTLDPRTNTVQMQPKTEASNRDVFIQPELESLIRKIKAYDLQLRMVLHSTTNAVFIGQDGERAKYPALRKYLHQVAHDALGRDDVTPHIFRHTHTSLMAEQGVSLDVISRRLGHESSDITRSIYLHVTKKRKASDNAEISRVNLLA